MKEHGKHKSILILSLSLFLLFSTVGCKSKDLSVYGSTGTLTGGTPSTVEVQLSSSAIANGSTVTVTAIVRDALGDVVPDVEVSFSVISSTAGSFSPATATTAADGSATTTFTAASPAGDDTTATIKAQVTSGTSTPYGIADLTIGNPPQVPTSLSMSFGSSSITNSGNTTVTVSVLDGLGVAISGASITFSSDPSGAVTFSPSTETTNGSGVATVTLTAVSPNTLVTIYATATNAAGTVSNSATLTIGTPPPPTPTSMSISINPQSVDIGSDATVSVTVLGAGGVAAFSTLVTLKITTGADLASFGTSSTTTVTTDTSGNASATITAGSSSGTVIVSASAGTLNPVTETITITSEPALISLGIADSDLTVGLTTQVTATVLNVMSEPVSNGTTVNFVITSSSQPGTISTPGTTINGVATAIFTATTAGSGIIEASAETSTGEVTDSKVVVVNTAQAGTLTYVSVVPESGVIPVGNGQSATVKFLVKDVNGSVLANQSVNFELTLYPCGASLISSTDISDSTGYVEAMVKSGLCAGQYEITASTTVPGPPEQTYYAKSPGLSIGGGVPSYKWFSVSREKNNIAGLDCDNVTNTIFVNIADRFGNYNILEGTSVSFHTYYGAIDTSNITNENGQTESVYRTQIPRSPTGEVSVLVYTAGEETFIDDNGDYVYNTGDIFNAADDLPEPFTDRDNDGVRDSEEEYFNWPLSVSGATSGYDGSNGQWDDSIPIWRHIKFLVTGPPVLGPDYSEILCKDALGNMVDTDITIAKGGSLYCVVYSADENKNPLVSGTNVTLESSKTEAAIEWVSGAEELLDSGKQGVRAYTGYAVSNNNSTGANVCPTLSATLNWTSGCGGVKTKFSYPGTITLAP